MVTYKMLRVTFKSGHGLYTESVRHTQTQRHTMDDVLPCCCCCRVGQLAHQCHDLLGDIGIVALPDTLPMMVVHLVRQVSDVKHLTSEHLDHV